MGEKRRARQVFSYLYVKNIDTKWRKRTQKLSSKYLDNSRIPSQKETLVKKTVRETEGHAYEIITGDLPKFKQEIARKKISDNSRVVLCSSRLEREYCGPRRTEQNTKAQARYVVLVERRKKLLNI